ncbi:MAG: malate synthase A [Bacteroidia bacterium]|nr:malate synthase A [Bacteroidia bacterium]
MSTSTTVQGVDIKAALSPDYLEILTPEALQFVAELHRKFNGRRKELLHSRELRQAKLNAGELPNFLEETAAIRNSEWTVAPTPADLLDRRVEITGPVDRKMIINALNSGAKVFMADFEDSNSPTFSNNIDGQINLRDAVRKTISFSNPDGKKYQLQDSIATLVVRPRGWHLVEKHVLIDGEVCSGSLFDFGLYFFHNAKELLSRGSGPYFYLPKMESHLEARLWNDVFVFSQDYCQVPQGSIRATVLIETILAAFEMDEILYELRNHMAGLNCGRWDYIFSFIKKFSRRPDFILPDRIQVTMATHFMNSYSLLAIKTCHKRNAHAIGGMSAFIPVKNDEVANANAFAKVRQDKEREANNGHDGTWVAHPGLVPVAMEIFNRIMPQANQKDKKLENISITQADLLQIPDGTITEEGFRANIDVAIQYLEAWLRGSGCVPLYNLMEDAATAEISRAQVWQWVRHQAKLADGRTITKELYQAILPNQIEKIKALVGEEKFNQGKFKQAIQLFDQLVVSDDFSEFLTLGAYDLID